MNEALLTEEEIQDICIGARHYGIYSFRVMRLAAQAQYDKMIKAGYGQRDEGVELPKNPYTEDAEDYGYLNGVEYYKTLLVGWYKEKK